MKYAWYKIHKSQRLPAESSLIFAEKYYNYIYIPPCGKTLYCKSFQLHLHQLPSTLSLKRKRCSNKSKYNLFFFPILSTFETNFIDYFHAIILIQILKYKYILYPPPNLFNLSYYSFFLPFSHFQGMQWVNVALLDIK